MNKVALRCDSDGVRPRLPRVDESQSNGCRFISVNSPDLGKPNCQGPYDVSFARCPAGGDAGPYEAQPRQMIRTDEAWQTHGVGS